MVQKCNNLDDVWCCCSAQVHFTKTPPRTINMPYRLAQSSTPPRRPRALLPPTPQSPSRLPYTLTSKSFRLHHIIPNHLGMIPDLHQHPRRTRISTTTFMPFTRSPQTPNPHHPPRKSSNTSTMACYTALTVKNQPHLDESRHSGISPCT